MKLHFQKLCLTPDKWRSSSRQKEVWPFSVRTPNIRRSPCYRLGILSSPVPPPDLWISNFFMAIAICWWAGATWPSVWIYCLIMTFSVQGTSWLHFLFACSLLALLFPHYCICDLFPLGSSQFQGAVLVQTHFLLTEVTYLKTGLTWDRGVHSSESLSQGWLQTLLHLLLISPLGDCCCNCSS